MENFDEKIFRYAVAGVGMLPFMESAPPKTKERIAHVALGLIAMSPFILVFGWMLWNGVRF